MVERLRATGKERAVEEWLELLYRPLPGRDPDAVSDTVIASELDAFRSFSVEVKN